MGRAVCCKSVAQTILTSCSCRIPFRMAKLMGRPEVASSTASGVDASDTVSHRALPGRHSVRAALRNPVKPHRAAAVLIYLSCDYWCGTLGVFLSETLEPERGMRHVRAVSRGRPDLQV